VVGRGRVALPRRAARAQYRGLLPTLATLHGPAQPMLGVDWGVSYDQSAAVAIGRLPVAKLNPDRPPWPTFGWPVSRSGTPGHP
jgi:hypothetical protein